MWRRRGLAVAACAALFAVAACGGDDPPSTPASSSAPPSSAAPAPPPEVRSPFTGATVDALKPVLAVKIDNVRPARPPIGLRNADVVYVEPVEGGLSRILAVFSSALPKTVGPVRSAREADLELLRQYGSPGFAYSGANRGVLPLIADAPVVDLSANKASGAYRRQSGRSAPHNLVADPAALLKRGKGVSAARSVGFTFGAAPAGGAPAASHTVKYPAASTAFTWSAADRKWLVSMDGRAANASDGKRLAAATVVVQYAEIRSSKFKDKLGNVTPYTETVGSGRALVLRDGRSYDARWTRPSPDAGTTFTTATGTPLPFAQGQLWIVYTKS